MHEEQYTAYLLNVRLLEVISEFSSCDDCLDEFIIKILKFQIIVCVTRRLRHVSNEVRCRQKRATYFALCSIGFYDSRYVRRQNFHLVRIFGPWPSCDLQTSTYCAYNFVLSVWGQFRFYSRNMCCEQKYVLVVISRKITPSKLMCSVVHIYTSQIFANTSVSTIINISFLCISTTINFHFLCITSAPSQGKEIFQTCRELLCAETFYRLWIS